MEKLPHDGGQWLLMVSVMPIVVVVAMMMMMIVVMSSVANMSVVVSFWIIVTVVVVLGGANYCGAVGNYECDGIRSSDVVVFGGGVGIETLMLGMVVRVGWSCRCLWLCWWN